MKASGDNKELVLNLMREVTKNSRFAHKQDLWTYLQNKMSHDNFGAAITDLLEDGAIYTAVDDNQFGMTE